MGRLGRMVGVGVKDGGRGSEGGSGDACRLSPSISSEEIRLRRRVKVEEALGRVRQTFRKGEAGLTG